MLEQEFKYYTDHQDELVKKFDGKFIVIKDNEVKGSYDTKKDAYFEGQKDFELGTFLIQFCARGNMFFTQTYHTQNVAF
jgi:hypothetical protein